MGRVVFVAFLGKPSGDGAEHAHEPGWSMRGPLVVLAVLAAGGGVLAAPFARLYGGEYHFEMGLGPSLAAALGLGGFALAYLAFGRGRARDGAGPDRPGSHRIADTSAVDRFYELGYRRVALALSDGLAWIDRYVVDGAHQPARLLDPRGREPAPARSRPASRPTTSSRPCWASSASRSGRCCR